MGGILAAIRTGWAATKAYRVWTKAALHLTHYGHDYPQHGRRVVDSAAITAAAVFAAALPAAVALAVGAPGGVSVAVWVASALTLSVPAVWWIHTADAETLDRRLGRVVLAAIATGNARERFCPHVARAESTLEEQIGKVANRRERRAARAQM